MSKFYVQSGNFRSTINAMDSEKAALWAIHKVMEQVLPLAHVDAHNTESGCALTQSQVKVLGEKMAISELGFDDPQAEIFDTLDLQIQWHQLAVALARLEAMVMKTVPECRSTHSIVPRHEQDLALCELVG